MYCPVPEQNTFAMFLMPEMTDPNGKHMEYKDKQGVVFARMQKVYKKGGLFGLFNADHNVHAELKDAAGNLILTTTSYRGETARECKVEIMLSNGVLVGTLYDAPFGVDFEGPDGTLLGHARRSSDLKTEPKEVTHCYTDAADEAVGSCERTFPDRNDSLVDFLVGFNGWGQPMQTVTIAPTVDPTLRTFLFLFPALQHLRFSRNW